MVAPDGRLLAMSRSVIRILGRLLVVTTARAGYRAGRATGATFGECDRSVHQQHVDEVDRGYALLGGDALDRLGQLRR
jgi:hypothetical protein